MYIQFSISFSATTTEVPTDGEGQGKTLVGRTVWTAVHLDLLELN